MGSNPTNAEHSYDRSGCLERVGRDHLADGSDLSIEAGCGQESDGQASRGRGHHGDDELEVPKL